MAETEIANSFNRPQLDIFHALWNLHNPHPPQVQQNSPRKRSQSLSREDMLRLFSIGTTVAKESGSKTLSGQGTTPALEGIVRGQRLGGPVATEGEPDGPEHAPTITRGVRSIALRR